MKLYRELFSNKNDIQSQAAKTQLIKDAGFELTIVGIDIDKSLYDGIAYHKVRQRNLSKIIECLPVRPDNHVTVVSLHRSIPG